MSHSYPIWNAVQACNYKSGKSWGSKDTMSLTQYIGSSAKNSLKFVEINTTRRTFTHPTTGQRIMRFRFFLDHVCLREADFTVSKHGTADELIELRSNPAPE